MICLLLYILHFSNLKGVIMMMMMMMIIIIIIIIVNIKIYTYFEIFFICIHWLQTNFNFLQKC